MSATVNSSSKAKHNHNNSISSKSGVKNKGSTTATNSCNGTSASGGKSSEESDKGKDGAASSGGIFRPFVVLALPGVNLFRRFSQYKRLPQDPPKDKLEVELERLNNKIVSKQ